MCAIRTSAQQMATAPRGLNARLSVDTVNLSPDSAQVITSVTTLTGCVIQKMPRTLPASGAI